MRFGEEFREPPFECERDKDNIHFLLLRLMHGYMSMDYHRFTKMGIYPGQLPVMRTVSGKEGISQRELAAEIHVKPPTVAVTIKRMEKAGLVCRKADRTDQRISRIYLTEQGKLLEKDIRALMEENERILTKGFSEEELNQLRGYMNLMIQNIREASERED